MVHERRGYIVLALISIALSLTVLLLGVHHTTSSNHKFCDLFNTMLASPTPKPADTKTDPSRARSYKLYLKLKVLDRSLGCE